MPRNTRDYIIRRHQQILTHVKTIQEYLHYMSQVYGDRYPTQQEYVDTLSYIILQFEQFMDDFKDYI